MKKQRVDKYAEAEVLNGKTHQEVYDHIVATSTFKIHRIAEIVRKIPTVEKRKQYGGMNIILLVLLISSLFGGITHFMKMVSTTRETMNFLYALLLIIPTLLVYCIYAYKRNMHLILGIWSLLKSLESFFKLQEENNVLYFINLLVCIIMAILSFYLSVKLVSDYTFNRELQERNPSQREGLITFID